MDEKEEAIEFPLNLKLETYFEFAPQSLYKALCKFALSVLNSENMQYFKDTIDWLHGNKQETNLPKIAILESLPFFDKHPQIVIYTRKTDNDNLPFAVGEFRFAHLVFVFILPLSNKDKKKFTLQADYDLFWNFFKHYNKQTGWKFVDFSNIERKKLFVNVNLLAGNK